MGRRKVRSVGGDAGNVSLDDVEGLLLTRARENVGHLLVGGFVPNCVLPLTQISCVLLPTYL